MSARFALRSATAADHERVDAIFARFRLDEAAGYSGFLRATAAAYLPVENGLDEAGAANLVPDWTARRRADLLQEDLAGLGEAPGPALPFTISGEAEMFGAIYVLEGSRLGGAMLKKSVPQSLPRRFLDAPAEHGAWRRFSDLLDDRLCSSHDQNRAIMASKQVFDLFAQAGLDVLEPSV